MRIIPLLLIFVLLSGCVSADPATTESAPQLDDSTPEAAPSTAETESATMVIAELAVRDLALRLEFDLNKITVVSIESVDWPNSALGCPLPGADYAQVITPGYRIKLEADGEVYTYHTSERQAVVLCRDGVPELPVIPVNPGEIQDGIPWVPVDPVPTIAEGDTIADPDPVR
jgi:hypothetical protein